tara:strand:+ start:2466 stop:2672 length:207 start_codon:yes stop_codon:yes gene_type:complete
MIKKSKEHLEKANESYFQHMVLALKISIELLSGAIMAFMHAFLPSIFTKGASNKIKKLHFFVDNRSKK